VTQHPQDPPDPYTRDPYADDPVPDDAVVIEAAPYTTTTSGASAASDTTYPTETYESESTGSDRAQQVKEEGRQVAGTAAEQARNVAGTAREEAGNVAQEAKAQARNLTSEARSAIKEQAQSQTQRAAGAVHGLADSFQALTEGRTQDAGPIGEYAEQASAQVRRFAERIDQRGFDGLVQDVQSFARRQPTTFLIGAAVAGFAVGRMVRGARDAGSDSGGSGQQYSDSYRPAYGTAEEYDTPSGGYTSPLPVAGTADPYVEDVTGRGALGEDPLVYRDAGERP
jgi:vacuolar-type H+-ATPase subunit H